MSEFLIFSHQSLQDLPRQLCWHHCPHLWGLLPCPILGVIPASLPSTRKLQTHCAELIQPLPSDQHLLQEAWDLGNPPPGAPVLSFGLFSRSISSIPPSFPPSTCPRMGTAPKRGALNFSDTLSRGGSFPAGTNSRTIQKAQEAAANPWGTWGPWEQQDLFSH